MASVTYRNAERTYPGAEHPAVRDLNIDIGDGEFLVFCRSVGLRQVHHPADARRPGGRDRRRHPHRRPGGHPRAAEGPRHRDGVPELRALPAHDRRGQHGLRAEDRAGGQGRDRTQRVDEAAEMLDLDALPRAQAQGAVRRPAPARRDGPRHRAPAAGVPAWTSRSPTSTPSSACRPARRSPPCSSDSASPPSTSPTTRSRP